MKGERVHLSVAFWPPVPQARPAEGEGTPSQCTALLRSRPSHPHCLPGASRPLWELGPIPFVQVKKLSWKLVSFPRTALTEGRAGQGYLSAPDRLQPGSHRGCTSGHTEGGPDL